MQLTMTPYLQQEIEQQPSQINLKEIEEQLTQATVDILVFKGKNNYDCVISNHYSLITQPFLHWQNSVRIDQKKTGNVYKKAIVC